MTQQEHNEAALHRAIATERREDHERREGCREDCRERRETSSRGAQEVSMLRYFSTSD